MPATANRSRSKLWLGFALMCVAVLVWVISIRWMTGSMGSLSTVKPGASLEEMDAAIQTAKPMDMMMKMLVGYAVSGVVFVGGLIVTAMGLIEFAAEIRKRE